MLAPGSISAGLRSQVFGTGSAVGSGRIVCIEGELGGGKSYLAACQGFDWVCRGGVWAGNFAVDWPALKLLAFESQGVLLDDAQWVPLRDEQVPEFHLYTPPRCLITLDEIHIWFNARDHAQTNSKGGQRQTMNWLTQARKDKNDVTLISQSALNFDRQFVRLLWAWYRCRDAEKMLIPGIGWPLPFPWFIWNRFDRDGRTFLKQWRVTKDRRVYGIYRTEQKYCVDYERPPVRSFRLGSRPPARGQRVFYGCTDGSLINVPPVFWSTPGGRRAVAASAGLLGALAGFL